MMEVPLVWETDVQRIVKDKADVIGMTKRERVPKPGHRLKLKSVQYPMSHAVTWFNWRCSGPPPFHFRSRFPASN